MMQRRLFLHVVILVCAYSVFGSVAVAQTFPPEVEAIIERYVRPSEEDREYRQRRDSWLESMHRTEPGLNWRMIDRESRRAIGTLRGELAGKGRGRMLQAGPDTVPGVIAGTWRERGSVNLSGRIVMADVDIERGLIYAASGGGNIWRGTMEGEQWRSLNDTMRISGVKMLRLLPRGNSNRIVAAGGSPAGVYLSDNDGESWHLSRGLDAVARWGWWKEGAMLDDSAHTVYMLGTEWDWEDFGPLTVLYRSVDACDSFTNVLRFEGDMAMIDMWAPQYDGADVLILHRDTLSRVEPNGSLTQLGLLDIPGDFDRFNNIHLTGTLVDGQIHLYAFLQEENGTECYVSADTGKSWTLRGITDAPFSSNSISASTVDPHAVFLGAVDCYRSYGAQEDFVEISAWPEYYADPEGRLHADIFGIQPFRNSDGSEFLLISTDGGLYISRDTLRSVRNLSLHGLNVSQYYSTLTNWNDPTICHAGSQDQGYQRASIDGGMLEFNQEISGDYGHLASADSGRTVWMNYPGFTLLARERGDGSGVTLTSLEFPGTGRLWLPPVVADPTDPNAAYLVGGASGTGSWLWRMTASDSDIVATELPFDFSNNGEWRGLTALAISPVDKLRWFAATEDGRFFFSTNGGESWEVSQDTVAGNHYFYGSVIVPSPVDANRVYVGGSGYSTAGVKVSYNGGRTFQPIVAGLPPTMVYDMAVDPRDEHLFAATEVGPYIFSTIRREWHYLGGQNAPDQTYWSVEYIPTNETARFGTYGRGIWDFAVDRAASVPAERPGHMMRVISMSAVPNPASGEATLTFTMPQSGHAALRVYDMAGRQVATLLDRHVEAGEQRVPWNLRSLSGKALPPGNYTCVVSAGGSVGAVRLVIYD